MAETKYGKYVMREPIVKGRYAPTIHICGEKHKCGEKYCAGSNFPNFPAEQALMCITEPFMMNVPPHAHDYDQLLYFLGGNPINFFDFGAEVELYLGKEGEKHVIDTTTIVYLPKGLIHGPLNFRRVDKPIMVGHICFAPKYSRSEGDMDGHPQIYETYSTEEIIKLRGVSR